ncbi:MAG: DNA alkylation repair protein [Elusimicrobiota bacterium]
MLKKLTNELNKLKDPEKAKILSSFFKTGKGEYGEGDVFLGIKVPVLRKVAKKYKQVTLCDIEELLKSNIHEYRFIGLVFLVDKYNKGTEKDKKQIADFYLRNARNINNWDLVDMSAPKILGHYLIDKDKSVLFKMAKSDNLWERRIAIVAAFHFIKNNRFDEAVEISEILLNDNHDLIRKAVGWMLREIGKRNEDKEEEFLNKHYKIMPGTMLRYAIERMEKSKREFYLKGEKK